MRPSGGQPSCHIDSGDAPARTIVIDTGKDTQTMLFQNGRAAAVQFLAVAPGQPAWDADESKYGNAPIAE